MKAKKYCPTCGHVLSGKSKTASKKSISASRENGKLGGRPPYQYVLVGFSAFGDGSKPNTAEVISRHTSKEKLDQAWSDYQGKLCLDWKEYEGEKVGQDMTDWIMSRI